MKERMIFCFPLLLKNLKKASVRKFNSILNLFADLDKSTANSDQVIILLPCKGKYAYFACYCVVPLDQFASVRDSIVYFSFIFSDYLTLSS